MKFYNVIYKSLLMDEGENLVTATPFLSKELALEYIKKQIIEIKKQIDEDEIEDYCIDETEDSYERYLEGRSFEDSVSIYLEESEFDDEKVLQKDKGTIKIYKVKSEIPDIDDINNSITSSTIFLDEELAKSYLKREIERIKKDTDDLDGEYVEVSKNHFERYKNGKPTENAITIWIETEETYDEKERENINNDKENEQNNDKENDYDI